MTATDILSVANNGTDAEVAALYLKLTGRNITKCIPCQKADARIELKVMAKKQQAIEANQPVNGYKVADKYLGCTMCDRAIAIDTPEQLAFWLRKAPYVLELVGGQTVNLKVDQANDHKEAIEPQA